MSDSVPPDEISALVGAQPDASWKKGDRRPKTQMLEKEHGWEIGSGLETGVPLNDQIAALLQRVQPIARQILKLSEDHTVQVSCVEYSENVPQISLPRDVLRKVADLGASIDIDLYISEPNWAE